ncbi:hypothetical protein F5Y17DRAFT_369104 [Xylariaceae sp. FL0594]|nr:hypothetical protein F5Y17DRAFT_369104 [Xylariaceae sp. FL0594]
MCTILVYVALILVAASQSHWPWPCPSEATCRSTRHDVFHRMKYWKVERPNSISHRISSPPSVRRSPATFLSLPGICLGHGTVRTVLQASIQTLLRRKRPTRARVCGAICIQLQDRLALVAKDG